MKASSATSAKATAATPPTGPSSAKRPPSRTSAESFALAGPSERLDPTINAFRKDLADVALAGAVLASHYAETVERIVTAATALREGPGDDREVIAELPLGEPFGVIEDSVGWAWGYGGEDRLVGYVRSEALGPKARS